MLAYVILSAYANMFVYVNMSAYVNVLYSGLHGGGSRGRRQCRQGKDIEVCHFFTYSMQYGCMA